MKAIQRWRASKNREVQLKIQSQKEAERRGKEARNQVLQHKSVSSLLKKRCLAIKILVCSFCLMLVCSSSLRAEVERKEVAQRLEDWREEKRRIKLEAEQRLTENIEKRRKEKRCFAVNLYELVL